MSLFFGKLAPALASSKFTAATRSDRCGRIQDRRRRQLCVRRRRTRSRDRTNNF